MTKKLLLEAAKKKSVTKETIKEFEHRVEKREKQFQAQSRRQAASKDFMARTYNL